MGHARDFNNSSMRQNRSGIHLLFPGDNFSVRKALKSLMDGLRHAELSEDTRSVVEIAMAEVLNNIVEHAYGSEKNGVIELNAQHSSDHLRIRVIDDGQPMPDARLPAGATHDLDGLKEDLPEGGFGWFLIRELTKELQYTRRNNQNILTFLIPLESKLQ